MGGWVGRPGDGEYGEFGLDGSAVGVVHSVRYITGAGVEMRVIGGRE